jgi:hypothetical protein
MNILGGGPTDHKIINKYGGGGISPYVKPNIYKELVLYMYT